MNRVFLQSFLFAVVIAVASYLIRVALHTDSYLLDVGGLSAFLSVFGTLYGILAAFVVFEVWTQYNHISELIDKEALGLEQLYRLTLYFRDDKLTAAMKAAIHQYADLVIAGNFHSLGEGKRRIETGQAFRKISELIRDIEFNDNHDAIIFDQTLQHYGHLAQIRTERRNQSLARLPVLLKAFIYVASFFALAALLFVPFANPYYAMLSALIIAFLQAMIFSIIEELDNPFIGHWNLTPEPFARAIKHIEEDY